MLVIKIELWPGGDESRKRTLHIGKIWRVRSSVGRTQGDYKFTFSQANTVNRILHKGIVEDFPRKRLSAWDLLYRCLREAFGGRN